jgi:hypothetical protein
MDSQRDHNTSRTAAASLPVSTVLRNAAELCERGWCQGAPSRDVGGRDGSDDGFLGSASWCALGAIWDAYDDFGNFDEGAEEMLRRAIACRCIPDWNDAPERTQAEVVAKLREAAALAESEGR